MLDLLELKFWSQTRLEVCMVLNACIAGRYVDGMRENCKLLYVGIRYILIAIGKVLLIGLCGKVQCFYAVFWYDMRCFDGFMWIAE